MSEIELSVVMPCLNEAKTVGGCVKKAINCMSENRIVGEVIVADNGSTDGSQAIALEAGARVISVVRKGYGAAITGGIKEARGRYIIMGDADDSYDFEQLNDFVVKLRDGFDLVMGNRFRGGIAPGAMPALHRYLGNPILSFIGRLFFKSSIGDFHCGLRGFNRKKIIDLNLVCPGMEFASEMVVKASLASLKIVEIPTTLKPDGRDRAPHLRSWRDGWRHLKFLLIHSPRWLFLYPGALLCIVGWVGVLVLYQGPIRMAGLGLDYHTQIYCGATAIVGLQMVIFAVLSKLMGSVFGLWPVKGILDRIVKYLTLDIGLVVGFIVLFFGIGVGVTTVATWGKSSFGVINNPSVLRSVILSSTMVISGGQLVLSWFFLASIQLFNHVRWD